MKRIILFFILTVLSFSLYYKPLLAQDIETRILFLLDGSGSMWGMWKKEQKINAAKRMLSSLVDSLNEVKGVELAFRAYGHRSPKGMQDCKDTRLEVPFGDNNAKQIIEKLKEIKPKGTTPISYSLSMAATDFPRARDVRNIIILITDGLEECEGDPCAVSIALQKRGIILKPFIIGIGMDEEWSKQLDCIGHFFNAEDEESFKTILNVVISSALNRTTAQVNLLDLYRKPTETDVNMTFYDSRTGIIKYDFYHTFNSVGVPDTLLVDPLSAYTIHVHTLPPVIKENVELTSGKHNIIAIDAPQGYLKLEVPGYSGYKSLKCLVRKQGEHDLVNVQNFKTTEKYIVGKYDVEILSLPRISLNSVEIRQNHTNTVSIQQPGTMTLYSPQPMIGSIYQMQGDKLVWIYNINSNVKQQSIILQPGTYQLAYRRKIARQTYYTNKKRFTINSGRSLTVNIK